MMKTLIKDGTIVTAEASFKADILIEGEVITQIGESLTLEEGRVIDAEGKLVLPGGVDPHVHHVVRVAGYGHTPVERRA